MNKRPCAGRTTEKKTWLQQETHATCITADSEAPLKRGAVRVPTARIVPALNRGNSMLNVSSASKSMLSY